MMSPLHVAISLKRLNSLNWLSAYLLSIPIYWPTYFLPTYTAANRPKVVFNCYLCLSLITETEYNVLQGQNSLGVLENIVPDNYIFLRHCSVLSFTTQQNSKFQVFDQLTIDNSRHMLVF